MPPTENPGSAGLAVFGFRNFRLFQVARFCMVLALEMQSVAVGWQIYEITHRALDLGYVGLAQFLPGILLFLVSGHVVDRFDRRGILVLCYCGYVLCSTLLLIVALRAGKSVGLIYCILILIGVVRSFNGPVSRAILPQLVPEHHFPSAVAWASSVYQAATILGPAVGGVAYAAFHGPAFVYAASAAASSVAALATTANQDHSKNTKPRARQRGFDARRVQIYLAGEINFRIDFVGSFCRAAWRSCRATAGLCARNTQDRTVGTWACCAARQHWEQQRWR